MSNTQDAESPYSIEFPELDLMVPAELNTLSIEELEIELDRLDELGIQFMELRADAVEDLQSVSNQLDHAYAQHKKGDDLDRDWVCRARGYAHYRKQDVADIQIEQIKLKQASRKVRRKLHELREAARGSGNHPRFYQTFCKAARAELDAEMFGHLVCTTKALLAAETPERSGENND